MKLLSLLLFSVLSSTAHAGDWIPRLVCDNGAFEVDGNHTFESGFSQHQFVIRNTAAISYLKALDNLPIQANEKGELIRQDLGRQFDGSFLSQLAQAPQDGGRAGTIYYQLHGHYVPEGYEVYVTRHSAGPGWVDINGSYIGKWTFRNCQ